MTTALQSLHLPCGGLLAAELGEWS